MARRDSPNSSISASSQSATSITSGDSDIDWPFGARLDTLRHSEIRETAYEIFFMCCRFSPGFGSNKGVIAYVGSTGDVVEAPSSSTPTRPAVACRGGTGMMTVTSRVKTTLGLRAGRPPPMRTMNYSMGLTALAGESPYAFMPNSPGRITLPSFPNKAKRPMTSAEIMRRQMRITIQSDNMLKKILQRSFLGQNGRRAESFILPLELLRHIKPSEFSDNQEYHQWQRRQLKILEVGLLIHPSLPLDRLNTAALQFREILLHSKMKPVDTSKNSDIMHRLSNAVTALAWRNSNTVRGCHWADGFPVNVHLYLALLKSIFDMREENVVLDEVDELLELMKKTWPILRINRMTHNVCFTWVLFQQYVITGQLEPDLIRATLNLLVEVANDVKMQAMERDHNYAKALDGVITSMQGWAEKRLLDYHENFNKGNVENMGNILSLALATTKIVVENIPGMAAGNTPGLAERDAAAANRVEFYIQRSMRNAFTKMLETGAPGHIDSMIVEVDEDPGDILIQMAADVEALAVVERENFSPVLRHWCPAALGVALLTLQGCFGVIFKQYLAKVSSLSSNLVLVLQCAGKLEKQLMQMAADDSADYDDGGRSSVLRDMIPYEVDTIGAGLLKTWVDERLAVGRESVSRAKETENWMPKSKGEQFTESVIELIKLAKVTVNDFFQIPLMSAREEMVHDLADGLESIFQDYANFAASCGTRQSYLPVLPPLTRCNQDSRLTKLWNKAKPCTSGTDTQQVAVAGGGPVASTPAGGETRRPRPSTSRGTHRLYIRINTLHYLHHHIHLIDKSLSFFPRGGTSAQPGPSPALHHHHHQLYLNRRLTPATHFDLIRASIQVSIQRVSEVAAYRLIFSDSENSFYRGLYADDVAGCRIDNALSVLKQNLKHLLSVLTDRAQPPAMKEVMRATFQAFLMVLLAGGPDRAFVRSDYEIVMEDLRQLKKMFCASGEGFVPEDVVDREAEVVEGIVGLMSLPTERLIEDFTIAACESSSAAEDQRLLMPPTTGIWSRSDPNTVLRVICHRNDDTANNFLKKAFQLPKRR
ncbi:hypothetical protein KSP39_PZI004273 [Platanthera zijinensis]|uniref:Protein unc-13 homolog n=1 Tax=Platanthera zijinensis TaxID=2320716 RepID=A0AAP0GD73_9ASPA